MILSASQAAIMDQLEAPRLSMLLLIKRPSGTDRMWMGAGPFDVAMDDPLDPGGVYDGRGILKELPPLRAIRGGRAERVSFSFSGIDDIPVSWMGPSSDINQAIVHVGMVWFDDEWQTMTPVGWLWTGRADMPSISEDNLERTVTLSVVTGAYNRSASEMSFWTPAQHRIENPTDTGLKMTVYMMSILEKKWPA